MGFTSEGYYKARDISLELLRNKEMKRLTSVINIDATVDPV